MSVLDFHGMVPFLAIPFAKSIATIPSTLGRDDILYLYIFSLIQKRVSKPDIFEYNSNQYKETKVILMNLSKKLINKIKHLYNDR